MLILLASSFQLEERESSHYGQSEIRANYGANQHHLQAARPKASAGEATICKKRGRK